MNTLDYFMHFHTIPAPAGVYVIDRQHFGIGRVYELTLGGDLLFTGEKEQCRNEFYERTKRSSNEHRVLYELDETIRFERTV